MLRKFRRDQLRKRVGNRNLRDTWERFQKRKYGLNYLEICVYPQIYNRR